MSIFLSFWLSWETWWLGFRVLGRHCRVQLERSISSITNTLEKTTKMAKERKAHQRVAVAAAQEVNAKSLIGQAKTIQGIGATNIALQAVAGVIMVG